MTPVAQAAFKLVGREFALTTSQRGSLGHGQTAQDVIASLPKQVASLQELAAECFDGLSPADVPPWTVATFLTLTHAVGGASMSVEQFYRDLPSAAVARLAVIQCAKRPVPLFYAISGLGEPDPEGLAYHERELATKHAPWKQLQIIYESRDARAARKAALETT